MTLENILFNICTQNGLSQDRAEKKVRLIKKTQASNVKTDFNTIIDTGKNYKLKRLLRSNNLTIDVQIALYKEINCVFVDPIPHALYGFDLHSRAEASGIYLGVKKE